MEQAELAALNRRAEIELSKIPGVLGVGYGLREKDGKTTDQPSLQVYVIEKKPLSEIPPGEVLPREFEGVPVDVLVAPTLIRTTCEDTEQHSQLIGGITITNFKRDSNDRSESGTLGFFATLNGVSGPQNVVLVSNNHVLTANGASVGDTISHPKWKDVNGTPNIVLDTGPIGKIHDAGLFGHVKYKYDGPSETEQDYFVDCATAKLDICISSWCKTNCGVSYKNAFRKRPGDPDSKLEGVARLVHADIGTSAADVYKVGSRTGRTNGKVTGVNVTSAVGEKNLIRIEVVGVDCDSIAQFNAHGDSGSAIVNMQNKLVGLLFSVDATDIRKAFACHIHPVLDRLNINPISTVNPPAPPAGEARSDVQGFFDGVNETVALRERFLATPIGAEIYREALARREEIVGLVNHRRPVTVAWHRAQGPAFLAHAIENARNPAHGVPREIEGVDRETLARRIAAALAEQGSPELRLAMEQWLPFVLEHAEGFDNLHELVAGLEKEPVDA